MISVVSTGYYAAFLQAVNGTKELKISDIDSIKRAPRTLCFCHVFIIFLQTEHNSRKQFLAFSENYWLAPRKFNRNLAEFDTVRY